MYITYAVNICTYTQKHTHFGKSHMQATEVLFQKGTLSTVSHIYKR